MKKTSIATITAGVVILGGGAWAATTLPASSEETVTSDAAEPTPTPDVEPTPGVTPTPDVTPTPEAVAPPEATPEPTIEPEPEPETEPEPEPEPAEPEPLTEDQIFLQWAKPLLASYGGEMSDTDMLAALDRACYIVANNIDERVIPAEADNEYGNINMIFFGAARDGYFTEGNTPASFCD